MPKKAKDVTRALEKKGFRSREGDHTFFRLYADGVKTTVRTKVSHGAKEIHDGLLSAMAKQTHLRKKEFLRLIDCPLSEEEYLDLLRERDVIAGEATRPSGAEAIAGGSAGVDANYAQPTPLAKSSDQPMPSEMPPTE